MLYSHLSQFICIFIYICNISLNILQLQHVTPQDRSLPLHFICILIKICYICLLILICICLIYLLFWFIFVTFFCLFCSNCLQGLKNDTKCSKGRGDKGFSNNVKRPQNWYFRAFLIHNMTFQLWPNYSYCKGPMSVGMQLRHNVCDL